MSSSTRTGFAPPDREFNRPRKLRRASSDQVLGSLTQPMMPRRLRPRGGRRGPTHRASQPEAQAQGGSHQGPRPRPPVIWRRLARARCGFRWPPSMPTRPGCGGHCTRRRDGERCDGAARPQPRDRGPRQPVVVQTRRPLADLRRRRGRFVRDRTCVEPYETTSKTSIAPGESDRSGVRGQNRTP
jgi:hypothetical protein